MSKLLKEHLKDEHSISAFTTYLKEIVYGGIDGIITTFAVVAGFTGAAGGQVTGAGFAMVLLFGFANLFADAASMGLGNFLSVRSERDIYHAERSKELYEIMNAPERELEETVMILESKGYKRKAAEDMANLYAKNPEYWSEFMMQFELEMPSIGDEHPAINALFTSGSFIAFGFIPLVPYVLLQSESIGVFYYSCFATLLALILLGILRWKVSKITLLRGVLESILVGGTGAIIAFAVGSLFVL